MAKQKTFGKFGLKLRYNAKGVSLTGLKGIRFRLSSSGLVAVIRVPGTEIEKQKTLISRKTILQPPGIYVLLCMCTFIFFIAMWLWWFQ